MQLSRFPNFIVIGAQKSGTSSLYANLSRHPEIAMATKTEVEFFSRDIKYREGLDLYQRYFCNPPKVVRGEVSPGYMIEEKVPRRMVRVLPNAKLIAILRHPVDRAYSAWLMQISKGSETLPFESAIVDNPSYFLNSQYGVQLYRFLDYYPSNQIHIEFFEDLRRKPMELFYRIFSFIGVKPDALENVVIENVGGVPRSYGVVWALNCLYRSKKLLLNSSFGRRFITRSVDHYTRRLRNLIAERNRVKPSPGGKYRSSLSEEDRIKYMGRFLDDLSLLDEICDGQASERWLQ